MSILTLLFIIAFFQADALVDCSYCESSLLRIFLDILFVFLLLLVTAALPLGR